MLQVNVLDQNRSAITFTVFCVSCIALFYAPRVFANDGFVGRVTITRFDWQADFEGKLIPTTTTMSITELTDNGYVYERLESSWYYPFRSDLSPTIFYRRQTEEQSTVISITDKGARAVIRPRPGDKMKNTYLERLLRFPAIAVCGDKDHELVEEIEWLESSHEKEVDFADGSKGLASASLGHLKKDESTVVAERMFVNFEHSKKSTLAEFRFVEDVDREKKELWNELVTARFRVLSWQLVQDQVQPHVVAWSKHLDRTKLPSKRSLRRAIAILEFSTEREPERWPNILPELRITDLTNNSARVVKIPRDKCAAWQQLLSADQSLGVLTEYLRNFPKSEPVFESLESKFFDLVSKLKKKDRTPKPFLPAEQISELLAQMQESKEEFRQERINDSRTKLEGSVAPQEPPNIIHFVNGMRRLATSVSLSQSTNIRRAGFVPVKEEDEQRARGIAISALCFLLMALGCMSWLLIRSPSENST